jgi:integral membrane protein (TIGR01906 family)
VENVGRGTANALIGLATALVIVALTLPLFLNPLWVAFEQGRAEATAWTGFTEPELRGATDAILADLVFGPPDFDVAVAGAPVLNERERGHMLDVRGVFIGFFAVAFVVAVAGVAIAARRQGAERARTWRAIRGGSLALIAVLLVGGIVSVVAFDALFEVFHRIFFAGGSYSFDPATERLVQLFPFRFWQETAIVLGAVCVILASVVAVFATRRASRAGTAAAGAVAVDPEEPIADGTSPSVPAPESSR